MTTHVLKDSFVAKVDGVSNLVRLTSIVQKVLTFETLYITDQSTNFNQFTSTISNAVNCSQLIPLLQITNEREF